MKASKTTKTTKIYKDELYNRETLKEVIDRLDVTNQDENLLYIEFSKIYKKIQKTRGSKLRVSYNQKIQTEDKEYGSLYANCGYQGMKKEYRNYFANEFYNQIDMNNCVPRIVNDLLKKNEISCPNLDLYANDRNVYLEKYSVTKHDVLAMMNQSYCSKENPCTQIDFFSNIWDSIYKEFIPKMKETESKLYSKILKKKTTEGSVGNIDGSFMSYLTSTETNNILKKSEEYLTKNGFYVDSLIFDGLLIQKNNREIEVVLRDLESYLKNELGFFVIWKKVDMETPSDLVLNVVGRDPVDVLETDLNEFEITEKDVAQEICKEKSQDFRNTSRGIYIRNCSNIWSNDPKKVRMVIFGWIQNSNKVFGKISKTERGVPINKFASKFTNFYTQILCVINSQYMLDDDLLVKLNKYKGYLPFNDSIYCFKTKEYKSFAEEPDIHYTETVGYPQQKRPSKEYFDSLKSLVIDPIFDNDQELIKEFFQYCARAIGGHVDKVWLNADGERDSGKGTLIGMFEDAFSSIVGCLDANALIIKKDSLESAERAASWLAPFVSKRLVFSSEMTPDKIVDGTKIKMLASGGDVANFREAHGTSVSSSITANWCSFSQTGIPKIKPADAKKNMLHFTFPCEFRVKDSNFNNVSTGIIKEANNDAKGFCRKSVDHRNAFMFFVLDFYEQETPTYKRLKESAKEFNMDEDGSDQKLDFLNQFEFTKKKEDFLLTKDVDELDSGGIGPSKINKLFKIYGSEKIQKKINGKNCRVFSGVKLKGSSKIKVSGDDFNI